MPKVQNAPAPDLFKRDCIHPGVFAPPGAAPQDYVFCWTCNRMVQVSEL